MLSLVWLEALGTSSLIWLTSCATGGVAPAPHPSGAFNATLEPARTVELSARSLDDSAQQSSPWSQVNRQDWPRPVVDDGRFGFLLFDQLEYRSYGGEDNTLRWDVQGRYGDDYEKLVVRTEGESTASGRSETNVEAQLLYSRLVAPFWDVQFGLRYDAQVGVGRDTSRWFGVAGFQGFAPYRFDVEPMLFVSQDGDVSARFTGTTDWLITQRLILQPRLETELALQNVEEFGVGAGLEYTEVGVRLRYEFLREFAPYIGFEWEQLYGQTASFARDEGGDDSVFALVFGLRVWL